MERTYTLHDVIAVLKRRRALALAVTGGALAIGLVLALGVPSEWSATSVVQIEPRRLPADFFPAQPGVSFEDRLRTVKHGILARPVLERVVRETDYAPDLRDDLDEAVSRLRRDIEVRLEGEMPGGAPGLLFVVEVRGKDREKVARAAELLPKVYAELTRQVLSSQARALRETLDAQAAALGRQLSDFEARILAFKVAHLQELPEMVETNARSLARIAGAHGHAARGHRRRAAAPHRCCSSPSRRGRASPAWRRPASTRRCGGSSPSRPPTARTTPTCSARAASWRRPRRAATRRSPGSARSGSRRSSSGSTPTCKDDRAALASLDEERKALQRRVDAAPRWGQELAALSRDYEVLRGRYTAAVSRRADASAAEALLAADAARRSSARWRARRCRRAPPRRTGRGSLWLALARRARRRRSARPGSPSGSTRPCAGPRTPGRSARRCSPPSRGSVRPAAAREPRGGNPTMMPAETLQATVPELAPGGAPRRPRGAGVRRRASSTACSTSGSCGSRRGGRSASSRSPRPGGARGGPPPPPTSRSPPPGRAAIDGARRGRPPAPVPGPALRPRAARRARRRPRRDAPSSPRRSSRVGPLAVLFAGEAPRRRAAAPRTRRADADRSAPRRLRARGPRRAARARLRRRRPALRATPTRRCSWSAPGRRRARWCASPSRPSATASRGSC